MKRGFAAVSAVIFGIALAAEPLQAGTVRMGVRADAKPFVYRDGDGYAGFLFDICTAAVLQAGHDWELVEVDARNRFDAISGEDPAIDLLCDPTTITLERLKSWDFTQILFIANAGFLERRQARVLKPERAAEIGCDVPEGVEAIAAGWLNGSTSETALAAARDGAALTTADGRLVCGIAVEDHDEGIARLCSEEGDLSYYFGDADILSAQIADYAKRSDEACPAVFSRDFLTYQPYALAVSEKHLPQLGRDMRRAFYAVFRTPLVAKSFETHFPDREPSEDLERLFRMYLIPPGAVD